MLITASMDSEAGHSCPAFSLLAVQGTRIFAGDFCQDASSSGFVGMHVSYSRGVNNLAGVAGRHGE